MIITTPRSIGMNSIEGAYEIYCRWDNRLVCLFAKARPAMGVSDRTSPISDVYLPFHWVLVDVID